MNFALLNISARKGVISLPCHPPVSDDQESNTRSSPNSQTTLTMAYLVRHKHAPCVKPTITCDAHFHMISGCFSLIEIYLQSR